MPEIGMPKNARLVMRIKRPLSYPLLPYLSDRAAYPWGHCRNFIPQRRKGRLLHVQDPEFIFGKSANFPSRFSRAACIASCISDGINIDIFQTAILSSASAVL